MIIWNNHFATWTLVIFIGHTDQYTLHYDEIKKKFSFHILTDPLLKNIKNIFIISDTNYFLLKVFILCNVLILCLPKYFKISTMTSSNIGWKCLYFVFYVTLSNFKEKLLFKYIIGLLQSIIGPDWKTYLPHTTYTMYIVLVSALQAQERKATHK